MSSPPLTRKNVKLERLEIFDVQLYKDLIQGFERSALAHIKQQNEAGAKIISTPEFQPTAIYEASWRLENV